MNEPLIPRWLRLVQVGDRFQVFICENHAGTLTAAEAERFVAGVKAGQKRVAELGLEPV